MISESRRHSCRGTVLQWLAIAQVPSTDLSADRAPASASLPGIPASSGWTATGNDGTRGHNIIFADGPFIYHLFVGWGTQVRDAPTRAQLIGAATKLYRRVHGRPAPR